MSVLVDETTRLAVAGITGREGSFHTLNNRRYGTNVVGGINPKKAGQDVEGIPVFGSWRECVEQVQANTAMIFVPPAGAASSILEAAAAGVALVIAITEGIPAHDELRVYNTLKRDYPGTRLIGPNCPGILSPGKANVGIRSATRSPRPGSAAPRSSASAATRCRARRSSTCSSCSRTTRRPS
jgi:succinyl-CoA synthetase alpha subunit